MFKPTNPKKRILIYYCIFCFVTILILFSGFYYYKHLQNQIKIQAHDNLSTLIKLKVREITNWRHERINDARFIFKNDAIKELIYFYINNPYPYTKGKIKNWLESIKENHEYTNISLIDTSLTVHSLFSEKDSLTDIDKKYYSEIMLSKQIELGGFYKDPVTQNVNLTTFVPLYQKYRENGRIFAVLLLRLNAQAHLFPLVKLKSNISKSSETFILRRDSNNVTYVNELRGKKNSALSLSLPLSTKNLPGAMVIQGWRGIYEGVDYQGIEVLADLDKIPDSNWYIESKIDLDEIYAPLRQQAFYILAGVFTLTCLCGSVIYSVWKSKKLNYYTQQLKLEREKKALQEHIDYLYQYANEIILMTDLSGKIKKVNNMALNVYGYTREEFGHLTIKDLRAPDYSGSIKEDYGKVYDNNGYVFETMHIKKNGDEFPVEISSNVITIEGKKYYQSFIRDITERLVAEEALFHHQNMLSNILNSVPQSIFWKDRNSVYLGCNKLFALEAGVESPELIIGKTDYDLPWPSEEAEAYMSDDREVIKTKLPKTNIIEPLQRADGKRIWVETSKIPLSNEKGEVYGILGVYGDITIRKQLEEQRLSHLRFLQNMERIHHSLRKSTDLNEVLFSLTDEVRGIFNSDRVWLLYPCDPTAPSFQIPVESFNPDYPGGFKKNNGIPLQSAISYITAAVLASDDPIVLGQETDPPIGNEFGGKFNVLSQICTAVYPKIGKPWMFGMHQCSYPRGWTIEEKVLFKEISRRLTDSINSLLFLKNLKESENSYRTLSENLPCIVYRLFLNKKNPTQFLNQMLFPMTGYKEEEIENNDVCPMTPLIISEDRKAVTTLIENAIIRYEPYQVEYRLKHKNGNLIYFLERGRPVTNDAEVPSHIDGVIFEITERKLTEEALKKRKDELERFERLTIGREIKMIELKKRIKQLESGLIKR